jgi:3-oxoadipate enol-lactonase
VAFVRRPDGVRLYYEVHGDPGREPLILLEGMGGDVPGWRRNVPHLAAELFVVAYDHRGNGHSDAPGAPATMATFVGDCLGVMERVRSLVLACTHGGHSHIVPGKGRAPKDQPWLQLYAPAFAEANPEHVEEDLRVGRAQPQHPAGQHRQYEAVRAWDAYDRLPDLRIPVLVLHGSEDQMIDVENARVLASRIPGAELAILEGAGHVYHSEQPERADEIVLDFVRRHRG